MASRTLEGGTSAGLAPVVENPDLDVGFLRLLVGPRGLLAAPHRAGVLLAGLAARKAFLGVGAGHRGCRGGWMARRGGREAAPGSAGAGADGAALRCPAAAGIFVDAGPQDGSPRRGAPESDAELPRHPAAGGRAERLTARVGRWAPGGVLGGCWMGEA